MKISRRWVAALALSLLAAVGVHHSSSTARPSAGGSWYSVGEDVSGAG